jgi:hypothetical protein
MFIEFGTKSCTKICLQLWLKRKNDQRHVFGLSDYSQHNNNNWLQLSLQRHVSTHKSHRPAKLRTSECV